VSENAINQMKADKALTTDLEKATSFDEMRQLIHNAIERSPALGITRNPETGQFVRREQAEVVPAAAASAAPAETPHEFKKNRPNCGTRFRIHCLVRRRSRRTD
jgi:hypothetical protein